MYSQQTACKHNLNQLPQEKIIILQIVVGFVC